jgi:valyl-tRNA synthetase
VSARDDAPLPERWIASRLNGTIADSTRLLTDYNFGEAGRVIHDFIWDELADWFVEAFKILARSEEADGTLLAQVYEKVLRLLHPYAPFVTEELWQRLTTGAPRPIALMMADWPQPAAEGDLRSEERWSDLMALTRAARTLRSEYRVDPAQWVAATLVVSDAAQREFWQSHANLLGALPGVRLQPLEVIEAADGAPPELAARSIAAIGGGVELLIPAEGLFDVGVELRRVEQELEQTNREVARLEAMLVSDFTRKAPRHVVQGERDRLEEHRARFATLERRSETLKRLGQQ